jgi:hypothetical protein
MKRSVDVSNEVKIGVKVLAEIKTANNVQMLLLMLSKGGHVVCEIGRYINERNTTDAKEVN